jgi:hypothetical protein
MQETRAAMTANYDILIGSGIGALTVAVWLSRQKHWRCLILLFAAGTKFRIRGTQDLFGF